MIKIRKIDMLKSKNLFYNIYKNVDVFFQYRSPFSVKSKMRFRGFGPWGGKKKRRE